MKVFRLFGTSACHLCELAHEMVTVEASGIGDVDVDEVDISGSDALFQRYGVLIPVLQHPDERELNWPFSPSQVQEFLKS